MAENDKTLKQLKEELVKKVDEHKKNPSTRAFEVFQYLRNSDFTNWDVVCFCVEYLGLMTPALPHIEKDVISLSRLIYTQHYMMEGNPLEGIKIDRHLEDAGRDSKEST